MDNSIHVTTFGCFEMRFGENIINDQDNRSKKIWTIIEYMTAFHTKKISRSALIDLLWSEFSISDSPENALKTCIHRVRATLSKLGYPEEMIQHKSGIISWNSQIDFKIDFEEFESLCTSASDGSLDAEERIKLYSSALQLYKGNFLPKCSEDDWVAPLVTYYHTLYIKSVHSYLELLLEQKRYHDMIDCCCSATTIDPYDELIHYYLILSLFRAGKQQAAIERYEKVIALYYNDFGINPSPQLTELRKEISKCEHEFENDLNVILADLHESEAITGAYKCDYSVFQSIYRLYARSVARTGQSIYLCLITMKLPLGANAKTLLSSAMERMSDTIMASLRTGDLLTRYSKNQYLIMLPSACYENSLAIGERILRNYDNSKPRLTVRASYVVKHLIPTVT